jgi:hypothetical protein
MVTAMTLSRDLHEICTGGVDARSTHQSWLSGPRGKKARATTGQEVDARSTEKSRLTVDGVSDTHAARRFPRQSYSMQRSCEKARKRANVRD